MNILSLHHVPFEGLGSLDGLIRSGGHHLRTLGMWTEPTLPGPGEFDILVVMGGPMGIGDTAAHSWLSGEKRLIERAIAAGRKVLGICLGAQLIAESLGARVAPGPRKEIGWYPVTRRPEAPSCAVGRCLPERFTPFHWHGDAFTIPEGAVPLGESDACATQGFVYDERVVGLQFHLETTRESAAEIIAAGKAEWSAGGPSVQTADEMLARHREFDAVAPIMARVWQELERNA